MGMSKGLRGAVSNMTHGFFITIDSVILYFKHIIHIYDSPLNGHPPSSHNTLLQNRVSDDIIIFVINSSIRRLYLSLLSYLCHATFMCMSFVCLKSCHTPTRVILVKTFSR